MSHQLYLWLGGLNGVEILGLWFLGFIIVFCFLYMMLGLDRDNDLQVPAALVSLFWPVCIPAIAAGLFIYYSAMIPVWGLKWLLGHRTRLLLGKYTI